MNLLKVQKTLAIIVSVCLISGNFAGMPAGVFVTKIVEAAENEGTLELADSDSETEDTADIDEVGLSEGRHSRI